MKAPLASNFWIGCCHSPHVNVADVIDGHPGRIAELAVAEAVEAPGEDEIASESNFWIR